MAASAVTFVTFSGLVSSVSVSLVVATSVVVSVLTASVVLLLLLLLLIISFSLSNEMVLGA